MLVVFAFCSLDSHLAIEWMEWVGRLGKCNADILLVCDEQTPWDAVLRVREMAEKVFNHCDLITAEHVSGWPNGPNKLFLEASKWAQERGRSFLWIEPDAIPTAPGWTDAIWKAYQECGKAFMGHIYKWGDRNVMSGIGMYPSMAHSMLAPHIRQGVAFDVANPELVLSQACHTDRLFHLWGPRRDFPPTFEAVKTQKSPENAFTLGSIPPSCVLWHRNKDSTLIPLLRQKLFPQVVVMLPFCQNDFKLMLLNLQFMEWLHGVKDATAVCHFDSLMPMTEATPIIIQAKKVFREVHISKYPKPPVAGWPWAPNVAFNSAAKYMAARLQKPWFWYEADGVAVKPDWLEQMSAEYYEAGQPFMGCHIEGIVPKIGHLQGTAIYPPDACTRMPKAMKATGTAFDTEMASETVPFMHATKLIQHNRGQPEFRSKEDVRKHLNPEAVYYHADKSLSILNYL